MKVEVRVFAHLREKLGSSKIKVELSEHAKLIDLLVLLAKKWPHVFVGSALEKDGRLMEGYSTLVNSRSHGLELELRDGDVVAILPPVGGG